ncbi:unnamed protein product [Ectocarpus fasciculatus]
MDMDVGRGPEMTQQGMQFPMEVPRTLVKFDPPIFAGLEPSSDPNNSGDNALLMGGNGGGSNRGGGGMGGKGQQGKASQLDDMVNSMLPPREWTEETGTWMQYVSKEPATRLAVIALQEQLDKKLLERQALETGICPVREDLYTQAFDELIRHVTLDGPERGLLCLRVRDEIRMTIDAYKTLYDSSVTFGVKKQLQAEQGMAEMEEQIAALEEDKKALELHVSELRNKVEVIEKGESERRAVDDKKRKEEVDFLKYQGQHLDSFLKQIGGSK